MESGQFSSPGWVLIDRSGRHFGTILNYLRDGSVPLPESTRELGELLGEARYYLVQGLIEDCQLALQVGDLDCLLLPAPTDDATMSIFVPVPSWVPDQCFA